MAVLGLESLDLSLEWTVTNECIFNNCFAALISSWEYTVSIDCVASEPDGGGGINGLETPFNK